MPARRALTRLNGLDPKKPRSADIGLGCALSTRGTSPSSAVAVCASRPQSTATNGVRRATTARIAQSVTASQPRPRWLPGAPGDTVKTRLSSRTP